MKAYHVAPELLAHRITQCLLADGVAIDAAMRLFIEQCSEWNCVEKDHWWSCKFSTGASMKLLDLLAEKIASDLKQPIITQA